MHLQSTRSQLVRHDVIMRLFVLACALLACIAVALITRAVPRARRAAALQVTDGEAADCAANGAGLHAQYYSFLLSVSVELRAPLRIPACVLASAYGPQAFLRGGGVDIHAHAFGVPLITDISEAVDGARVDATFHGKCLGVYSSDGQMAVFVTIDCTETSAQYPPLVPNSTSVSLPGASNSVLTVSVIGKCTVSASAKVVLSACGMSPVALVIGTPRDNADVAACTLVQSTAELRSEWVTIVLTSAVAGVLAVVTTLSTRC